MSYNYAGYHHRQCDLPQPAQPYQQPCNYPNGADPYAQPHYSTARYHLQSTGVQFPFQPNAYQPDGHQQRHPYQARQPTSWDPPWMRQTTAYQQPPFYEPDMNSPPPPRPACWDPPAYWETPGQRPFHEVSAYDQPLPPTLTQVGISLRLGSLVQPPQRRTGFKQCLIVYWRHATGWRLDLMQPTAASTTLT